MVKDIDIIGTLKLKNTTIRFKYKSPSSITLLDTSPVIKETIDTINKYITDPSTPLPDIDIYFTGTATYNDKDIDLDGYVHIDSDTITYDITGKKFIFKKHLSDTTPTHTTISKHKDIIQTILNKI